MLIIFPLTLSPKVTCPPSLASSLLNCSLSLVMCLEHPLLRYQLLFALVDFKHTNKTKFKHSFKPKPFLVQVGQSQGNPKEASLSVIFYRSTHYLCDLWSCNKNIQHFQIYFFQKSMISQYVKHAFDVVVMNDFYNSFESQCETYIDNGNVYFDRFVQHVYVHCVVSSVIYTYYDCVQCTYKHVYVVVLQFEPYLFMSMGAESYETFPYYLTHKTYQL